MFGRLDSPGRSRGDNDGLLGVACEVGLEEGVANVENAKLTLVGEST